MSDSLQTLPASSGDSQTSTQDPQTVSQPAALQPTTSNNSTVLTSAGGVPLQSTGGTAITLSSTTLSTQPPTAVKGHADTGLAVVAILLFVVAIVLFGSTMSASSAKNTTE